MATSSKNTKVKALLSGAVGGPSTGAGLNYQVNCAVLRLLQLCTEFLGFPIGDLSIQIEPRAISSNGGATSWDLVFNASGELVEVKLNPTKQDLSEWITRVQAHALSDKGRFVLIHSRTSNRRLLSLRHLIRIAEEAGTDSKKFKILVDLENVPDAENLIQELGVEAHDRLRRMKIVDLSEASLAGDINLYCNLLAGRDRSDQLRELIFTHVSECMPKRATIHVQELIQTLMGRGIRLTPVPAIQLQGLEGEIRDALFLLGVCPAPLPGEVLGNAVGSSLDVLRTQLDSVGASNSVVIEAGQWKLIPSPVAIPKPRPELCEKALRAVLAFIGEHKYHAVGQKQVRNALALAEICIAGRPSEVARMFIALDKAVKGLGDKHLVLKAADLAITAARRASPRRREEAEGEAQAIICGQSWALQRIGRLKEAMIAAEKSLQMGRDIPWDRNTAYCEKCIGRLYRVMAEATEERIERTKLLEASISRLQAAIELFAQSSEFGPTHPEVGDCYSLLGRTYWVAGKEKEARGNAKKASELITECESKDYLDLLILQGELLESSNRDAADRCYQEVLRQESGGDSERSEILARAYFRRAINRAAMGKKQMARSDFEKAKSLWAALEEFENSARASLEIHKLAGEVPAEGLNLLSKETLQVKVAVIEMHQARLKQGLGQRVSRRSKPDRDYWTQLVKEARSKIAIESRQ